MKKEKQEKSEIPPRQRYIPKFIVYAALGIPKVNIERWRLKVRGLVERELELSYKELLEIMDKNYEADFHCVTRWSIKGVVWEGVSIRKLAELSGVRREAKWLFVKCLDGYATIIPIEDALDEKAIIALRMNGKEIPLENGYPARIFVPHLYGWKSAKWVEELEFIEKYRDGYWEKRGYHERGNVWNEERFKS